jgi:hypothetical protein
MMQGNRVIAVMAFIVLLGLVGCNKDQPHPSPAEAAAPAAAQVTPPAPPPNPVLNVDTGVNNPFEVHTAGLAQGTALTWTYSKSFYVQFPNKNNNPCSETPSFDQSYSSPGSGPTYTVTCTMKNPPSRRKYLYNIGSPTPPPSPTPSPAPLTGHCEGCIIEN